MFKKKISLRPFFVFSIFIFTCFSSCADEFEGSLPSTSPHPEKLSSSINEENLKGSHVDTPSQENAEDKDSKNTGNDSILVFNQKNDVNNEDQYERDILMVKPNYTKGEKTFSIFDLLPDKFKNKAVFESKFSADADYINCFHSNQLTADKVCNLLNYEKSEILTNSKFASPKDNTIATWSPTDQKFYVDWAHLLDNSCVSSLRCFTSP
jgi:hypothetical protein